MASVSRSAQRAKRHRRLRRQLAGTASRPRLSVCVSSKHLYVQLVDDTAGRTLLALSTLSAEARAEKVRATVAGATRLGQWAAEKAKALGLATVVFDRGGHRYHGRVKALAEAARQGGLSF